MLQLRPEVQAFAQLMEQQLRKNDHKPGWSGDSVYSLYARLIDEQFELSNAIRDDPDSVLNEAADLANFAMMIACHHKMMGESSKCILRQWIRLYVPEPNPDDYIKGCEKSLLPQGVKEYFSASEDADELRSAILAMFETSDFNYSKMVDVLNEAKRAQQNGGE